MTTRPDPQVFLGIASFGKRASMLQTAVESLLGQVDRMGIYLNNYEEVPDFLDHPRIEVARSQEYGDIRDNGKFFFLPHSGHRYYATADDDIEYPPDYIQRLRTVLADAGTRAAVGVHGAVYPTRILGLSKPRRVYHYLDSLQQPMPVHLIGTGTLLFEQAEWGLEFEEFGEPGMADVWFARAAKKRMARLFVVNRDREWLTELPTGGEATATQTSRLYAEAKVDDSVQVELLSGGEISDGGLESLVLSLLTSGRFAEEFTLSQAVALDEVRKEMGWLPLDSSIASKLEVKITSHRSAWRDDLPHAATDPATYTAASIGLLTGDLSAEVADATLASLAQLADMAGTDQWKALPYPLRFDTRESRYTKLRGALWGLAVRRSAEDARKMWPRLKQSGHIPLHLALEVERAGVDTGFQRLPALRSAASKNSLSAASLIRDYFEVRDWSVDPDVLAWRRIFGSGFHDKEIQLLLCLAALRTSNPDMAARRLRSLLHRWPFDFDIRMMEAVACGANDPQIRSALEPGLSMLDEVLSRLDIAPYRAFLRSQDGITHWIDLLAAAVPPPPRSVEERPQISIIMTVHNDASTLPAAMASVLASREVSVELILVDDASSDETPDVVDGVADPRVTVIRNPQNLGPYVSRNRALERAQGDFITIADADDWSHPERLAFQSRRLTEEQNLVGCTVAHMRVQPGGQPDLENNLLFMGHGPVSLMFRRSVLDQVGGFDHVRTRGDIEFIRRLRARFGDSTIASYEVPLILATSSPTSNSKRFTTEALDRYRRAARQWHTDNSMSDGLYVSYSGGERAAFVAPGELLARSSP